MSSDRAVDRTSRLQDKINIAIFNNKENAGLQPCGFTRSIPARAKIKQCGLYFIYLFINGPIMSRGPSDKSDETANKKNPG